LRSTAGREIRCSDAIAEKHDRQHAVVLARHPAKSFGVWASSVNGFGPTPGVRIFILFSIDQLTALNSELPERRHAEIDELEIAFRRHLRIDVTGQLLLVERF